jgi:hypothetical protein
VVNILTKETGSKRINDQNGQNLWFFPNIMSNQKETNKTEGAGRMHMGEGGG